MFKSAATKIAHNSTLPALAGNQDLRPLQDLITAEKAVIVSLQKLSVDFSRASEALRAWGLGEGDDLGNILSASTTILTHFSSAISQYAAHGHTMREQLKAIRTREESLDELKRRRRGVMSKADSADKKLAKMSPEHKNLPQQTELLQRLREEIRGLDFEIMKEEAAIGDFKRSMTRSWMGLKFGGLLECCEKGEIAGEFGKMVISEIPEDETQPGLPRNPYYGHAKVENLVAEAHRCANEVRLSTVPSAPQPQRRLEQQLPQVPTPSDSPFIHQGNFTSPQQPPMDTYSDNPRNDFLPEPQGLGGGRFLDSPTEPTASTFNHQPQYSGSLSSASALQSGANRRPDEFGLTSGPIDTPSAGGGRFATFPVKGRSGSVGTTGGYQFRDDPSLPSADHGPAGSLSSSVAQTPAASERASQERPVPPDGKLGQHGRDEPAPAYDSDPDKSWTSSQRLGPNDRQLLSAHARQTSNLSEDEALLAYMTTAREHDSDRDTNLQHDKHVSRHVRFGDVREIDDQSARSPISPQGPPVELSESLRLSLGDSTMGMEQVLRLPEVGQPEGSNMPRPTRVAVPSLTPNDEEKALDAAAAREIALELSAGGNRFGPSSSPFAPLEPAGGHLQRDTFAANPQKESSTSPLIPPTASYMAERRRSVSPRPEYTADYAGGTSAGTTSSPLTQQNAASVSPFAQRSPSLQSQEQPPSRFTSDVPEFSQAYAQRSDSYPVSRAVGQQEFNPYTEQDRYDQYTSSSPMPASQAPPPQINLSSSPTEESSFSGRAPFQQSTGQQTPTGGGYDPNMSPAFQTPPEYPTHSGGQSPGLDPGSRLGPQAGAGNSPYLKSPIGAPLANRSTSSLSPSIGSAGGGKISAAAFKRPTPRHGSGGGPPSPLGGPGGTMPGGGSFGTEGKRMSPSFSPAGTRGDEYNQGQSRVQPARKRETQQLDGDQYDYISAYVNRTDEDEGADGGYYDEQARRAANAGAGGGGWAGIGAHSGLSEQQQQQPMKSPGGYGEGRFATNLDRESLM